MQVVYDEIVIDNCWASRALSPGVNNGTVSPAILSSCVDRHASVDLAFITDAAANSVQEYVFYVFFQNSEKRVFTFFFEMTCQKTL